MSRALGVMFRLRLADLRIASNIAALNRLPISVLLLDDAGDVTFANDRALETLRRMDGLELHSSELQRGALGRLKASNPADDGRLQREIAAAVSIHTVDVRHFTEGVVLHRPNGRAPLLLQLSALSLDNEYSRRERHAAAIGFLVDPASQLHLDPQLLKDAFGLTRAECALAQEMLTGDSLKRIASTLSLSTNTIKSQLDAIFAKTGVHRQAHLVKLLVAFAKPGQH
ncbi:MAG TPA: helix-turn-helix transcriptional regulator [Casimicrobiaceae bacterium]|nr:helix-turn-helix transcriptional regulator [Casimicrobiaceae bacterium]